MYYLYKEREIEGRGKGNDTTAVNEAIKYEDKRALHMFLAGFTCGAVAYFVTSPFHVIKTMIQAEKNTFKSTSGYQQAPTHARKLAHSNGIVLRCLSIVRERGIAGLWKGSIPVAARGALFTSGQMLGYDGFKTFCKSYGLIEDGTSLHILSSIVAAFGATLLSTPADFIMSRYVTNMSLSLSNCILDIYRENGILGFWRGSVICFVRVCPVMLSYSTIYEQLRYSFGLGYLS